MSVKFISALLLSLLWWGCTSSSQKGSHEKGATDTLITPATTPSSAYWTPSPQSTFQWQLEGTLDTSVDVEVFDIDLFTNDAAVLAALHDKGKKVICYLSVGSWEDWRPDKADFPPKVIGKDYEGWPGEKWLDIRRIDLLGPIFEKRFDMAKTKGCDAIEPDNMDGFENNTGFPLTSEDQLKFNRWLAEAAHKRGMSIGMKNDSGQVAEMVDVFDWALTEDCHSEGWCNDMKPFVAKGKAVFQVEYTDKGATLENFCPPAKGNKFVAILKNRQLDAFRKVCP